MRLRVVALVAGLCCVAAATDVCVTTYPGMYGPISIPIYTFGHCRFQCITPAGWQADAQRSGDEVVRFTPVGTTAVFIAISATPVSLSAHELQAWRVPALRQTLCAGRPFIISDESFGVCDGAPCWNTWGVLTNTAPVAAGAARPPVMVEHHTFCIRNGYLLHFQLTASAATLGQYLDAFSTAKMTFRSRAFEANWSSLNLNPEPAAESRP
jgi:hypothetical protein